MNNHKTKTLKKILTLILALSHLIIVAQTNELLDYSTPKKYELGGIVIEGANNLNNSTLIAITELEIGKEIEIPGIKITKAINKLWDQGLFSNIEITLDKIVERQYLSQ